MSAHWRLGLIGLGLFALTSFAIHYGFSDKSSLPETSAPSSDTMIKTADFIESDRTSEHPVFPPVNPPIQPKVLGLPVTEQGKIQFEKVFMQNPTQALDDLTQAWKAVSIEDRPAREALLEMTSRLAESPSGADAADLLYAEASEFMQPSEHRDQNHGQRALQAYLLYERQEDRLRTNLANLGINFNQVALPASPFRPRAEPSSPVPVAPNSADVSD